MAPISVELLGQKFCSRFRATLFCAAIVAVSWLAGDMATCNIAFGAGPTAAPRFDACGDPLPLGALARLGTMRFRLPGPFSSAIISPDKQLVACCGMFGGAVLVDTQSGVTKKLLGAEYGSASSIVFSGDSEKIAVAMGATGRSVITVYSIGSGQLEWEVSVPDFDPARPSETRPPERHERGYSWFTGLSISADAESIAATIQGAVRVWKRNGNRADVVYQHIVKPLNCDAVLSHNGKSLFLPSDDQTQIRELDVSSGQVVGSFPSGGAVISEIALSPDGKVIVTSNTDRKLDAWSVASRKLLWSVDEPNGKFDIADVTFSADGESVLAWRADPPHGSENPRSFVASSSNRRLWAKRGSDSVGYRKWRVADGKPDGAGAIPKDVEAISLDLQMTVQSAGAPRASVIAVTPSPQNSLEAVAAGHTGQIDSICFSPDGRSIATAASDHTVRVWDAETGKQRCMIKADSLAVLFSRDGQQLITGQKGTVNFYDAASGKEIRSSRVWDRDLFVIPAISPDGKDIAVLGYGVARTKAHAMARGDRSQPEVTFDFPLSVWNADATTRRWYVDLNTDRRYALGPPSIAFEPMGRTIVAGDGGTNLWSFSRADGAQLGHVEPAADDPVSRFGFTEDSKFLIAACRKATYQLRCPDLSDASPISLSSDGSYDIELRRVDGGGAVRIGWNATGRVAIGIRISKYAPETPGYDLGSHAEAAVSPDCSRLAVASSNATVLVWRVDRISPGASERPARPTPKP